MKIKTMFLVSFLILMFILLMTFPCKAATVWSDNFNDGNYNGWTVSQGNFSVEDGALNPLLDGIYSYIYRSSIVAEGTWSFDAYYTAFGGGQVAFMFTADNNGVYGYELEMSAANMLQFKRVTEENEVQLLQYYFPSSLSGWQHFDITRDSDGRLYVYHNGTLVIDIVDTTYSESQFFAYYTSNSGQTIDNIVVSNTVDVEPPPQVPFYMQSWFLIILAITSVVVVVAVFTVFLRRKKY